MFVCTSCTVVSLSTTDVNFNKKNPKNQKKKKRKKKHIKKMKKNNIQINQKKKGTERVLGGGERWLTPFSSSSLPNLKRVRGLGEGGEEGGGNCNFSSQPRNRMGFGRGRREGEEGGRSNFSSPNFKLVWGLGFLPPSRVRFFYLFLLFFWRGGS